MEIHGQCDDRFSGVLEAFEENFASAGEVGACFAASIEGEMVIDIWGGHAEAQKTRPWEKDTIACVYSTTKTMTFLCALMLADRGELDFDAPVAKYWPEFAANGKQGVLVKHLMAHSSGLAGFSHRMKPHEIYDWDFACADLAAQAPWWEPGTQSGYHAITQGYLIGEVIRRISGKSFGTFFKQEVADKVDADFHIGVDPRDFDRISGVLQDQSPVALDEVNDFMNLEPDSIAMRAIDGLDLTEEDMDSAGWRQAEIPAANGHGNARSVVRAQTAMANGGTAYGVELLSPAGCKRALEVQTDGTDLVMGLPLTYCMGYALRGGVFQEFGSRESTIFWGGAGGSMLIIDTKNHICFSYVMNQMSNNLLGNKRSDNLGTALYAGL